MKKSVIIAALGLAAGAVSSFGQGTIIFNSYLANASVGIQTLFNSSLGGGPVGAGFTADLLYSLTPITDASSGHGALTPGWITSGSGAPSDFNVAVGFGTSPKTLGYFQGTENFVLNPYTAGSTVYFEVIAYQTAAGSYANATQRGHSASFSATLATGINSPNEVAFAPFTVDPVPEPTTLALAGLGGLASLMALRRRQS
jgi:hypothetical protein